MSVTVLDPRITVTLKKNIGRSIIGDGIAASQRFTGTVRQIDLSPFLGEGGAVAVAKTTRAPAGGFSITFPDKAVPGQMESLYGLIEPMDIIEISMAHDVTKYSGLGAPIMMRGFVTKIRSAQMMGPDGTPRRVVIVTGQDYGKIFQLLQVNYNFNNPIGVAVLTCLRLAENYGVQARADQPAGEFIQSVVDNIVNPFIDQMQQSPVVNGLPKASSPVQKIGTNIVAQNGVISAFGSQVFGGGTIWELVSYYGDVGPFNELFIEDAIGSTQPVLVYRPNPFMDLTGAWIFKPYQSDASTRPAFIDIVDSDIISVESERSDEGVFNYFWVDAPTMALADSGATLLQNSADRSSIFVTDQPNVSPELYGVRKLMVATQQGQRFDGQSAKVQETAQGVGEAWLADRRAALVSQNVDNVVLESGSLVVRGDETIRAGTYARITRGAAHGANLTSVAYVAGVTHQFIPYGAYTTSINFDRGTSFVERVQRGTGVSSPYLAEQNPGGVYA